MNIDDIEKAANILYDAEKKCSAVDQISSKFPDITEYDAYKIQLHNIERRIKQDGVVVSGKKIGLTSEVMRAMLKVNEPAYGHLLSDMCYEMESVIECSDMILPKIEPEIAFLLKKELKGPGIKSTDVIDATSGVLPAFEIIDTRIKDWIIKFEDTVADNGSTKKLVLGSNLKDIKDIELRTTGVVLEKNGIIVDTAAAGAIMGNPVLAVAWLANKLCKYGISLKPGEIVLSGSLTKAYDIRPGDIYTASFGGLGTVKAVFK